MGHDPSADIWVDGRTRPVATTFEPLGRAMMFRELKVSGSTSRALRLEPLLHACQAVSPGIVDEHL